MIKLDYPGFEDVRQKIGEEIEELMGHALRDTGVIDPNMGYEWENRGRHKGSCQLQIQGVAKLQWFFAAMHKNRLICHTTPL